MNEKLQYAEMLDIPVSTCSVTYRPPKKRKLSLKKNRSHEEIKELVIKKVNDEQENTEIASIELEQTGNVNNVNIENDLVLSQEKPIDLMKEDDFKEQTISVRSAEKHKKFSFRKLKIGVVGIELIVIGVLITTIFLTNALVKNSGVNVFMRNVFGTQNVEQVDDKLYTEFMPELPVSNTSNISVDNGVMTFSGEDSVYSPCDGKVTSVMKQENGKYFMEITHNKNFKTTFSGLDYAYSEVGDTVYSTIPVGYISGEAKMCFFSAGDNLITDYTFEEEMVVWKSLS